MTRQRLTLIALTVVVVEIAARVLASQLPPPLEFDNYEQQRQIERIVAHDGPCVDIALGGTSLMGAAGDPQIVGAEQQQTVANVALGGGGPLIMEVWFEEVVDPHLCPATVVLGIGPRDANDNFLIQAETPQRYRESRGRAHLIGSASRLQRLDRWLSRNTGFFGLRTAYRRPATALAFLLNGSGEWRENSGSDGRLTAFDNRRYTADPRREASIANGSMANFGSGGRNLEAMNDLIGALKARGAIVVLVDMPRAPGAVERIIGPDQLRAYEDDLASLAEQQNVRLLQADDTIDDATQFADEYHVNRAGSLAFSMWLAGELR